MNLISAAEQTKMKDESTRGMARCKQRDIKKYRFWSCMLYLIQNKIASPDFKNDEWKSK
jgi:hypothetical protein